MLRHCLPTVTKTKYLLKLIDIPDCRFEGMYLPHPHSPCMYLRCGEPTKEQLKKKPTDLKGFLYSTEYNCPPGRRVDDRIFTIINNYMITNPCKFKDKRCLEGKLFS